MTTQRVRGCLTKIPYTTEAEAQRDAKRIRKAGRFAAFTRIAAYKCRFCPGWHIGHWKKRDW